MKIVRKIILWLIVIISIILAIGFLDAQNFDNFLYQYIKFGSLNYYDLRIWDFFIAVGTIVTALVTAIALWLTYKTGIFDKTPNVLASGTFIISTLNEKSNTKRDEAIDEDKSMHTLQLINVGKGLARNVVPSRMNSVSGEFLEDVCPHSFVLPSGKSTRDLGEILRVHGQIFKPEEKKMSFENNNESAYFYINYEDYLEKSYKTKVKISKVGGADGKVGQLLKTLGIEVWKVTENTIGVT